MKKITLFAIAALSFALLSCSKEPIQTEQENDRTFSMTLSASVNDVKATMSDDWQFAFAKGDQISLTNNKATDGPYVLTRDEDGNFTGEVTAPVEAATWYAYYPSHSVSLAKQTGTKDGTAAIFALAGKQENVPARSRNLNMTLNFQTAILVIEHTILGGKTIDINVKTVDDDKWVSGLAAKNNDAAFDVTKSDTPVSLLTASTVGTYYLVVPAGVKIAVYDGNHLLVRTKSDTGLSSGKYYTVNTTPVGALPGMFTVADPDKIPNSGDEKKVFFSKGNLWADASGSGNPVLHFEENQYDFATSYNTDHVSHFMWAEDLKTAVGDKSPENPTSLFCDSVNKQSVDGSGNIYYALSYEEFAVLTCYKMTSGSYMRWTEDPIPSRNKKVKTGVEVHGKQNCIILLPDYWDDNCIISLTEFESKDKYDGSTTPTWSQMEKDGAVCFPAAGSINVSDVNLFYWTSTIYDVNNSPVNIFKNSFMSTIYFQYNSSFGNRNCLRLVTDCW